MYAAPDGLSSNNGSYDAPIDLQTALTANIYRDADIVVLKDGDYEMNSQFDWDISFKIVRAENLWEAVIDTKANAPDIIGSYGALIGIVFTSSETDRQSTQSGSNPSDMNYAGRQINLNADNSLYRDCIFKNLMTLGFFTPAFNSVMYGCHSYFNGWIGAEPKGHGHGIYPQNDIGTRLFKHNVVHDNFAMNWHMYEGDIGDDIIGMILIENISFNPGGLYTPTNNYLIGHDNASAISIAPIFDGNLAYGGNIGINFYNQGANDVTLTDNYMPPGKNDNYTALVESGNNFTTVGNTSFLFPHDYEDGVSGLYGKKMAFLTIYNQAAANTVQVDVSAVFANGDVLDVMNAQNLFGDIQELTVAGGLITVNMQASNRTVEAPSGVSAPSKSFPVFGELILRKQ